MRYRALTTVLIAGSVLLSAGCGTTRRTASERFTVQGSRLMVRETGDSLREEISRNLNENVEEHEVVTETVIENDSVRTVRVTERTRTLESGSRFRVHGSKVRTVTVHDTVYVERRDSVMVQGERFMVHGDQSGKTALHGTLKWVFWILCAIIALVITVKMIGRRGS